MNSINIDKISGLLNILSNTNDFFKNYELVTNIKLYGYENFTGSGNLGFLIQYGDGEYCINVPINSRSFLNIKWYFDHHIQSLVNSYGLHGVISNNFNINYVLAYIHDAIDDYFETFIIVEKDNKFICSDILISDVFCMSNHLTFPIYINSEITKRRKINFKQALIDMDLKQKE
jgi:bifunctional DNase/RNase